jgi:NTE family protein
LERLRDSIGPSGNHATNIAIACRGGGSHAAFTAGVLARLLSDLPDSHRFVDLSGASGDAVSATAAWYGLRSPDGTLADVAVIELHREQSVRSRVNRRSSVISDRSADGGVQARNFLTALRAT